MQWLSANSGGVYHYKEEGVMAQIDLFFERFGLVSTEFAIHTLYAVAT